MIYFVDEHHLAFSPWLDAVRDYDYEVETIWNANHAYRLLHDQSPNDVDLTIIDVMLAVDYALDLDDEQFSHARTKGYLETGLCLLEDLALANPAVFPHHAVLLTNAFELPTLTAAKATSSQFGVKLWAKSEFSTGAEFASRVVKHIESLRSELQAAE
jgi:hypothetical protein